MKSRTLLFVAASLIWASRLVAIEKDGLEVNAFLRKSEYQVDRTRDTSSVGEGHQRYNFTIVLRNLGDKPLAVLKQKNDFPYGGSSAGDFQVLYMWDIDETATGEMNIPAESELGLVKLQKGEATQFHLAVRTDQKIDEKNIRFVYAVSKKIAARFGTWSGRIEVEALDGNALQVLREKRRQEPLKKK